MKKVRKIEIAGNVETKKLRVAAYCRVSTKYESQKSSWNCKKSIMKNTLRSGQTGCLPVFMQTMEAGGELQKEQSFRK